MKKISLIISAALAAIVSLVSCDNKENTGYEGTNYIYLSTEGASTLYLGTEDVLKVDVMLTKTLTEDVELTFASEGLDKFGKLEGNPLTIRAGEKKGAVTIKLLEGKTIEKNTQFSLGLDATAPVPENVKLKAPFTFNIAPLSVRPLTKEQEELLATFAQKSGVDLTKYIGVVNVSTKINGFSGEEPIEKTITGTTQIGLSKDSCADSIKLDMLANAMGLEAYMYEYLKSLTINNNAYWFPEEYASPCYKVLVDAIKWTNESEEVFIMKLPNINIDQHAAVRFLEDSIDEYEDVITKVPFTYSFTAYEREVAALPSIDIENVEGGWGYDCTVNPAYHLNSSNIAVDDYEAGNWIESTAVISNEKLEFSFCLLAGANDSDYTRVVATYTPVK